MNELSTTQQILILCVAPPRSGLGLLSGCLRLLGLRALDDPAGSGVTMIDRLLLQELDCPLWGTGPLPEGWQDGSAGSRARTRLERLLGTATGGPAFAADPLLCRTLPLWLSVLPTLGFEPRPLLLMRHPHEVALSLGGTQGLDLADGHLLWLAWTRQALAALQGRAPDGLTLDRLLADPVTALARLPLGEAALARLPHAIQALLDFAQPGCKRYRTADLPGPQRERFAPAGRFYDWLCRHPAGADPAAVDATLAAGGAIDSLFAALDRRESRPVQTSPAPVADRTAPWHVGLARDDGAAGPGRELARDGQWRQLDLDLPEAGDVELTAGDGVLRLAGLRLTRPDREETVWEITDCNTCDGIVVTGAAARLADRSQLVVVSLGTGGRVRFHPPAGRGKGPLHLALWYKVAAWDPALGRTLAPATGKTSRQQPEICAKFVEKLRQITFMWGFQHGFRLRSEAFATLSSQEGADPIKTPTFWGAPMRLLPQNEDVSSKIYAYGLFEPELCSFFIDFLFQGAVVLDVGAHIGFFSLLAAALVGEEGRVFAFEPTPSTGAVLADNVAPHPQVTVVPQLAWYEAGEHVFQDFGPQFSAFNTALVDRLNDTQRPLTQPRQIRVPAVTLDGFCRERGLRPDLVKIDAESAELQVLRGMDELLSQARPVVTFEVGDLAQTLAQGVPRSRAVLDHIMAYGYQPLEMAGGRIQGHRPREAYDYDNLVLVPVEKLPARRPLGTVAVERGWFF